MAYRNCMYETTFASKTSKDDCLVAESIFAKQSAQLSSQMHIDFESKLDRKSSMMNLRKSLSLNSLTLATNSCFSIKNSIDSLRTFSSYENLSSGAASRSESKPSISSFGSDSHTYRAKSRSRHFLKNLLNFSKKKIVYMLSPISDKSYPDISMIDERVPNAVNQKAASDEDRDLNRDRDDGNSSRDQKRNENDHVTINKFDLIKKIDLQIDFDSGISIQSSNASDNMLLDSINDFEDLPFDMPKLTKRIQNIAQQRKADEPFAFKMPKLSNFKKDDSLLMPPPPPPPPLHKDGNDRAQGNRVCRTSLSLNGLSTEATAFGTKSATIDANLPLNYQNWYHGLIDRRESENQLRIYKEGSFLVRSRNSNRTVYILSIKSILGYFHVRIKSNSESRYSITDSKMTFESIPELICYFSKNRLSCVKGAEHLFLSNPIDVQLL